MSSVEKANQKLKHKQKKKKQTLQLNPNWAQIRQKLNTHTTNGYTPTKFNETLARNNSPDSAPSILGKRKERSSSDTTISQPNVLIPTSSDSREEIRAGKLIELLKRKMHGASHIPILYVLNFRGSELVGLHGAAGALHNLTKEIAMDCEMVGVTSQGNKSALGRVTLVNKWGNVVYDEFVRPVERVVDFRTQISGIRPRDMRKAKDFRAVQKKVAELITGKVLVGHALRNDLKVLLLSHPKKDIRDTSEYPPFLKESHRKALRHLAEEFLGVQIQNGEHCPVEDARAAMVLYQQNRRDWEKWVKDQFRLKEKQKRRKKKKPAQNDAVEDDSSVLSE